MPQACMDAFSFLIVSAQKKVPDTDLRSHYLFMADQVELVAVRRWAVSEEFDTTCRERPYKVTPPC